LEESLKAVADANDAAKAYLDEQVKLVRDEIGKVIGEIALLKEHDKSQDKELRDHERRLVEDARNGTIFEVGVGGVIQGGQSLYTGDPALGGEQIRSGVISAGTVNITVGQAWPNRQLTLDIGIGGGVTGSEFGQIPVELFSAGVVYAWVPNGGNLSIGPTIIGMVDTTQNPFRASSSEIGAAVGVQAGINLPGLDDRGRREIVTTAYMGVANGGFDNFWSNGPYGGLSLAVKFGRGPVR
jgi:hypothetical protein